MEKININYIIIFLIINISLARAVDMSYYVEELPKVEKCKGGYRKCEVYKHEYFLYYKDTNENELYESIFYNDIGQCIEKSKINWTINDKSNIDKSTFLFDSINKLIEVKISNGKELYTKIYKYNESAKVETSILKENNNIVYKYIYYYNNEKQLIKSENYNIDSIEKIDNYLYNNKNLIVKQIEFSIKNIKDTTKFEINYEYDKSANLFNVYWNNKLMHKYIYNNKNEMIEEESKYVNDNMKYIIKMKYDDYGNIIEKIEYNDKNEPQIKYFYIYSK